MYNVNRDVGVKEISLGKLKAWLGIHMTMHAWRYPDRSRYWGGGSYAGVSVPDFTNVMSYRDWLEIRRNLRFEDYRREDELKAADKAWKIRPLVNLTKSILKRVNPCPGQHLSLDEAMTMYTGFKCPIVVGAPSKLYS